LEGRVDKFLAFMRRYLVFVGGAVGSVLLAGGVLADPSTKGGTVLVALGGSMLAASLLALISLTREDLLEALFRQGVIEVFPSRIVRCGDGYWRTLLAGTTREYRVLGVANHGYIGQTAKEERYEELFRDALGRGVVVEFLWLSPDTPIAERREIEEGRRTRSDTVKSIMFFWGLRKRLGDDEARSRLLLKEHKHLPSCGLTKSDDSLTVTHYVAGQDNQDAPGWILTAAEYPFYRRALAFLTRRRARPDLVEVYFNTYREVQAEAVELTDERIDALGTLLAEKFSVDLPSEADKRQEQHPEADNES
jgi:hypothetical protein